MCSHCLFLFFFSSRRRHTRSDRDWSSDVCSSDLDSDQSSGLPPTETDCYTPSSGTSLYVEIKRNHGSGSPRLDLWTIQGAVAQYQVPAGSLADPSSSPS